MPSKKVEEGEGGDMSPGVLHNPSFEGLPRLEGSKTQLLPRWVYPPLAKSQLLLRGWWTPPQYIFKQRDANGTWNSAAAAGLVDPPAQVFKRSVMYDGRVPSCCGGGVDPPLANLQLLLLRRRGCTLSAAAWGHGGDNHHLREARRPDEWPTLISDKCIQG